MQILTSIHSVLWKPPFAVLVLHQKIQRSIHLSAQTPSVIRSICFCYPGQRSLDSDRLSYIFSHTFSFPLIPTDLLSIRQSISNRLRLDNVLTFRISYQCLDLTRRLSRLVADQYFIIPCFRPVAGIDANVSRSRLPSWLLSLPFNVCRRPFLIVEVPCERQRQSFIQSLLVEIEGFLK